MKKTLSLFLICLITIVSWGQSQPGSYVKPVYQELPLGAIRPEGWLKHQLQIMRNGTSGHLDEVYAKIKNDNGWLGGTGDAWEETPYWLDGAVPLAWLLNDINLQKKVKKYIDWTIEHQRPSGYFGGITKYEHQNDTVVTVKNLKDAGDDWWPKMVMLKAMKQYYQATGDQRVIEFMDGNGQQQRSGNEKNGGQTGEYCC